MSGPEQLLVQPNAQPQSVLPNSPSEELGYDYLFDPSYEGGSVKAAKVAEAPLRTEFPESEIALGGLNLARKPQAPLSESDISKLSAHRGER